MAELVFPDGSRIAISAEEKQSCGVFRFLSSEIESPIDAAGWAAVQAAAQRDEYPDIIYGAAWFQLMRDAYAVGCTKVLQRMVKSTSLSLVVDPELPERKKLEVMKKKLPPLLDD